MVHTLTLMQVLIISLYYPSLLSSKEDRFVFLSAEEETEEAKDTLESTS